MFIDKKYESIINQLSKSVAENILNRLVYIYMPKYSDISMYSIHYSIKNEVTIQIIIKQGVLTVHLVEISVLDLFKMNNVNRILNKILTELKTEWLKNNPKPSDGFFLSLFFGKESSRLHQYDIDMHKELGHYRDCVYLIFKTWVLRNLEKE